MGFITNIEFHIGNIRLKDETLKIRVFSSRFKVCYTQRFLDQK